MLVLVLVLAFAVAGLAAPRDAHATPPAAENALAVINAERQANGIPPLTENPQWSEGCAEYDRYLGLNKNAFWTDAHHEQPGLPGYTADGALAASFSELISTDQWGTHDPFDSAPLHLASILSPLAHEMGLALESGYTCLTTQAIQSSGGANVFYTYPAAGRTNVPPSESTATEIPDASQLIDLPDGTGPFLFVYGDGPWTQDSHESFVVDHASLIDADGRSILMKVADQNTPKIAYYVPVAAAMLVPISPLAGGMTYTATVTVTSGGVTLSHTWSFTTASAKPDTQARVAPDLSGKAAVTRLRLSAASPTRRQIGDDSLTYTLSDDSFLLTLWLYRRELGYRARGACLAPSWRSFYPTAPRCPFWAEVGTFNRPADARSKGEHTLSLSALTPHGMPAGSYKLSAFADAGRVISVMFTVRP